MERRRDGEEEVDKAVGCEARRDDGMIWCTNYAMTMTMTMTMYIL